MQYYVNRLQCPANILKWYKHRNLRIAMNKCVCCKSVRLKWFEWALIISSNRFEIRHFQMIFRANFDADLRLCRSLQLIFALCETFKSTCAWVSVAIFTEINIHQTKRRKKLNSNAQIHSIRIIIMRERRQLRTCTAKATNDSKE